MPALYSVATEAGASFENPEQLSTPRTGRPSLCTPELIARIAGHIRTDGLSDSAAGLLAGVSRSTLSRWKQEDEALEIAFGQARALFQMERARNIREAVKRDGTLDWRAQAWLLQFSDPEVYGTPSRRRIARAERELREACERQEIAELDADSDAEPEAHSGSADSASAHNTSAQWGSADRPTPEEPAATSSVAILPESRPPAAASSATASAARPAVVTPADLQKLQEVRLRWLRKQSAAPQPRQNVQICPESAPCRPRGSSKKTSV